MTSASFSRPGAVDLSALKSQSPQGQSQTGPGAGRQGAGFVQDVVSVEEFQTIVRKSLQYPLVIEFYSPQGGQEMSRDLIELSSEYAGKFLLVRVDCVAHADIAQAIGIQGLPTVVAVVGGQLAPLFQGVQPRQVLQQVLDQVFQAAVANGIVGKAEPVVAPGEPVEEGEADRPADPRFDAAYDAMERGHFAQARDEFDKLLTQTPNDADALAGRAQAGLLARSTQFDGSEPTRASARPDDVDAQLAAADFELVQGDADAAFDRLIEVVRRTAGDDREQVRLRLLELFETLGATDPVVLKYRRKLATALF